MYNWLRSISILYARYGQHQPQPAVNHPPPPGVGGVPAPPPGGGDRGLGRQGRQETRLAVASKGKEETSLDFL